METFRYFAIFSFTKVERSVIISYKNGLHELLHNWGHSVITSECWSPFHFCYKMLWKFGGGWDFHSSFVKYQIMFLKYTIFSYYLKFDLRVFKIQHCKNIWQFVWPPAQRSPKTSCSKNSSPKQRVGWCFN